MARVTKNLMNNLDFRSTEMGFGIIRGDYILHRDDRIEPGDQIVVVMPLTGG